jgi:hypothetical protein
MVETTVVYVGVERDDIEECSVTGEARPEVRIACPIPNQVGFAELGRHYPPP